MAKHRKTRKQKVRSDFRQEHVITSPQEPTVSETVSGQEVKPFRFTLSPNIPTRQSKSSSVPSKPLSSFNNLYAYVGHDLKKTGVVTAAIVIAQLALFVVLK
jgi:hypothetical protein